MVVFEQFYLAHAVSVMFSFISLRRQPAAGCAIGVKHYKTEAPWRKP